MRGRIMLVLLGALLLASTASPAAAGGGICIPSGDPHHRPPLCIT